MRIEVKNLTKRYGKTVALNQVNLLIEQGMYGLLGPNGAGKTTLMKIMTTILAPTEGTVLYDGYDVTKHPDEIRKRFGYLPQDFGVYESVSVRDFLAYVGVLKGLSKREIKAEVARVIEVVNLVEKRDSKIKALSGGMKQRVGIAQAFLGDPEVIIVDEPTAGLDPEERIRFRNILAELSIGKTVVLSTHIVSDIEDSCYQVSVLDYGRTLYTGELPDLAGFSRGRVWETVISSQQYEEFKAHYQILNVKANGNQVTVRFIHKEPIAGSKAVEPSLEFGYLCLLNSKNQGKPLPMNQR